MNKLKASAYLITLNEGATIEAAIKSLQRFDEIIVVDSGSTDQTVRIASELGAKVIHQPWLGFARQKAFALAQCKNTWCINLDGDEILSQSAFDELTKVISKNIYDLIRFPIEDFFMGQMMHPKSRKRTIIRAFKKTHASYPEDRLVHENVISDGRIYNAKNYILHYGYDNTFTFVEKFNKYASLSAEQRFAAGRKASVAKLFIVFPLTFVKVYLFRKLFLSGIRGFIQANIEANYAFLKEVYLYEKERTRDNIVNNSTNSHPPNHL